MISKQNILEMINEEVIFRGFSRNNIIINSEFSNYSTDWHSNYYVLPYIGKQCRILGQDEEDGSIRCEFQECDMQGETIYNIVVLIELVFEFAAHSNGLIDYDPVFERIQHNIIHINPIPVINNHPILNNNIIQNTVQNVELWQIIEEQLNDIP